MQGRRRGFEGGVQFSYPRISPPPTFSKTQRASFTLGFDAPEKGHQAGFSLCN